MINIEMEQDNSCVKCFWGEREKEREEGKGVKREVPEKREGDGIALKYTRKVTFEVKNNENDQLTNIPEDKHIQLKVGQNAVLVVQSQIHDLQKETKLEYSLSPENGIFKMSEYGNQLFRIQNMVFISIFLKQFKQDKGSFFFIRHYRPPSSGNR